MAAQSDASVRSPTASEPEPGVLIFAIWAISLATTVIIAFVALRRTLAGFVLPILTAPPGPSGWTGLLFAALVAVASVALLAGAWRLAASGHARRRPWVVPLAVVGLTLVVRATLAIVADGAIYGETRIIRDQAIGVLEGTCCFTHRPMGYPIALAGSFAVLGPGPTALEALNLVFAAITALLVWDIARVGWGDRVAALAGTGYALMPSQVLLVLVPLTELMYAAALAATVRLAMAIDRRVLLTAALAGAALAVAQYVRATAPVFLGPVLLLPFAAGWGVWASIRRGAVIVAVFLALLVPVVAHNLEANDALSISTSSYGGWSLFVGANREHGGRWNAEDAALLAGFPGDTWWARSEHAERLAFDRIGADPAGYVQLMTEKLRTLWRDENYAAAYAFALGPDRVLHAAWLVSQLAYLLLVLAAVVGIAADGRRPRPATLLIGMLLVVATLVHLVLEVHGRYHSPLVPLLCVLAAAGVGAVAQADMPRKWAGWR